MRCPACNAEIFWAENSDGLSLALDIEPSEDGTHIYVAGTARRANEEKDRPLYTLHAYTCKDGEFSDFT